MSKYDDVTDAELFFSVGSSRPERGRGLLELVSPMSDEELLSAQTEYDEAVEEMHRRDAILFFPYHIPKRKSEACSAPDTEA